jgi:hypothetical protein
MLILTNPTSKGIQPFDSTSDGVAVRLGGTNPGASWLDEKRRKSQRAIFIAAIELIENWTLSLRLLFRIIGNNI